ncbi:beta-lactamase regulating signal transducer with metallopeptidase domain [Ulvibacter sp. MAR_2010_11]|uniref:M56 family metallopeptidase n=1 Tax=Ulvibacter sp. MAR_2010_11 TaxID=1250229 RepID=UPI000C2C2D0D|nr:M56 family metallopeptidase [Ulvibacter sp. MAR_2010_11]PKA82224.1 beta-lactamase regulating signal transducer with metallopeptidase domain [Ulvibacter sp. MAR_2010_11]
MELLIYLGKSAGIIMLFYLVYYLFVQNNTLFSAKRQFLILGGITAFFLPWVEFNKVIYVEAPVIEPLEITESVPLTHIIQQNEAVAIYWWEILLTIYLLGVLVLFIRFIYQLIFLINIIRSSVSERIEGAIHVRVPQNISPFSFFKYIVYNPTLHSEDELKMILKHEQIHTHQWHTLDILFANLLGILQWVNPFAWLYKNSIEENLEFIADNKTAAQVPSKKAYQLALVRASSPSTVPALTNNFYQSFIKKRIIMLNKSTSKKVNVWKLGIILPLLAVFLWSFNVNEVVKFKTTTSEIIPAETDAVSTDAIPLVSEKTVAESDKTEAVVQPKDEEELPVMVTPSASEKEKSLASIISKNTQPVYDIYIRITKNTTEADLKIHKKTLKEEHNVNFNYSNLQFNANGELTAISVTYSDNKGTNGNYSVSEDGPIDDFYIYLTDDGSIGFGSENIEKRRAERDVRAAERTKARVERIEQRKKDSKLSLEETDKRVARAEERAQLAKKRMEIRKEERAKAMVDRKYAIASSSDVEDLGDVVVAGDVDDVLYVDRDRNRRGNIRITSNTTDSELEDLKNGLAKRNITFSYKNVKRNSDGDIISIKIKMKNENGSESVSNIKSDGKPIKPIRLNLQ